MGVKPNKKFTHVCRINPERCVRHDYIVGLSELRLKANATEWCKINLRSQDWSYGNRYWEFWFRDEASAAAFALAWS